MQGQAGIDDVFDDDDVAAFETGVEVLGQAHFAARRGAGPVAGAGHEVDGDIALHGANQVAEEKEGALEHADKMQLASRKVLPDFLGEVVNAGGEFVRTDHDSGLGSRHGRKD